MNINSNYLGTFTVSDVTGNEVFPINIGGSGTSIIHFICIAPYIITGTASITLSEYSTPSSNLFWSGTISSPTPGSPAISVFPVQRGAQIIMTDSTTIELAYSGGALNDSFSVSIGFYQIPSTNTLTANFLKTAGTLNTDGIVLSGPSQSSYMIKSILVNTTAGSARVRADMRHPSVGAIPISSQISLNTNVSEYLYGLAPNTGTSYPTGNLSLQDPNLSLYLETDATITYYVSYTYDPQDV